MRNVIRSSYIYDYLDKIKEFVINYRNIEIIIYNNGNYQVRPLTFHLIGPMNLYETSIYIISFVN